MERSSSIQGFGYLNCTIQYAIGFQFQMHNIEIQEILFVFQFLEDSIKWFQVSDFILNFFIENKVNRYRVLGDHNVDRTQRLYKGKKSAEKASLFESILCCHCSGCFKTQHFRSMLLKSFHDFLMVCEEVVPSTTYWNWNSLLYKASNSVDGQKVFYFFI